jgi:hypothetical protein
MHYSRPVEGDAIHFNATSQLYFVKGLSSSTAVNSILQPTQFAHRGFKFNHLQQIGRRFGKRLSRGHSLNQLRVEALPRLNQGYPLGDWS